MPYDDDPYWGGFSKPSHRVVQDKRENHSPSPVNSRSYQWNEQVLAESKRTGRAPKPSPLLQEYMKKNGIIVK